MLFYLTNTLIVDKTDPSFCKIKRAVRNLAVAATEGKHIVLGDVEAVNYFSDIFVPNDDDVSVFFNRLRQNIAIFTIPSAITLYVEVINGKEQKILIDRREIKQLDYSRFLDTASIQATSLLCEDIEYDCPFYKFILQWYINKLQENVNTNLNVSHGGGDRIAKTLRDCVKKGLVCLCIVDSDIVFCGQPLSNHGTAYECLHVKRGELEELLILNVHEAENLLPFNYIELVPNTSLPSNRKSTFRKLYQSKDAESILRYFDFKNGLLKKKEFYECYNFVSFAKVVCEADPEFLAGTSFNEYYNSRCINEELYPGVAGRILKFTLEVMNKDDLPIPELAEYQLDEWNKVGQVMLNYCCAERMENMLN